MANSYSDQLKLRMPALGDQGWDDEVNDNVQILEVLLSSIKHGNSVVSGLAPSDGGGLDVDYAAGVADVGDAKRTVSASSETCTANVKNWLYVDSSGVMQISTTAPTGDYCPIAMIDAGASSIDRIADLRFIGEVHIGYKSDGMRYAADAEASDAYAIDLSPTPAAYYNGMVVNFKANTANTGTATLNVNSLGAKTIKKHHDQDLATGDIESGQIVTVVYDGTNFQMQSQSGKSAEILGDGTAGRVLRRVWLDVDDGTNANTIKVQTGNRWNGDIVAQEDNLGKGGDTGNFNLDATGSTLKLQASGLSGNCVNVIGVDIYRNYSGTALSVDAQVSGNDLQMSLYNLTTGAAIDLTSLVDSGRIVFNISYMTDA